MFNANEIEIILSESLFQCYCGLVLSGYKLGLPQLSTYIKNALSDIARDQELQDHFSYASIDDGRINPYWPRAYFLTVECLLENENPGRTDIYDSLLTYSNIGKNEITDEVVDWLVQNELFRKRICLSRGLSKAWTEYKKAVYKEKERNLNNFHDSIQAALDRAFSIFPVVENSVTVVLNPLQAWQLTDIVTDINKTWIVMSKLHSGSAVHELIHKSISEVIDQSHELIASCSHLLKPVFQEMVEISYAWDETIDSWLNVYSETFVRVATCWVLSHTEQSELETGIHQLVKQGFIYAPAILSALQRYSNKNQEMSELIIDSLEQCNKIKQNINTEK